MWPHQSLPTGSLQAQSYLSPSDTLNYFNVAHNTLLNISKGCSYYHLRQNLSLLVVESRPRRGPSQCSTRHGNSAPQRMRFSYKTRLDLVHMRRLEPSSSGVCNRTSLMGRSIRGPKQSFIRNDRSHRRGAIWLQQMCDVCVKRATIVKVQTFLHIFGWIPAGMNKYKLFKPWFLSISMVKAFNYSWWPILSAFCYLARLIL